MGDNWGKYLAQPKREQEILERLQKSVYPQRMDTRQKQENQRRAEILRFWKLHGRAATEDAFQVCERTLFRWQRDTTPKSRAHRSGYQKRTIHPKLRGEILRLRNVYPRLGKEKLTPLLREFCEKQSLTTPSEPTVGRMIAQLKGEGILRCSTQLKYNGKTGSLREKNPLPKKKKLRRHGYLPEDPGDLLQIDGVLINTLGQRRYTFTAVDLVSRWAFSKTYKTASSRNGADFLHTLLEQAPFTVSHIQTDNGSEFMKEFREAVENTPIIHFHNWVKQPKYQGWVERFNRTLQESFLDWHYSSLAGEPEDFNPLLAEWIHFYNTKRVHRALGRSGQRLTPLQYLALSKD